jgi:hypothetical protein
MAAPNKFVGDAKTICIHIYMGNIITGTSQHVFGLDKILHKAAEPKTPKKIIRPQKYIVKGKSLYAFVKRV